jgi:hypothetical protein
MAAEQSSRDPWQDYYPEQYPNSQGNGQGKGHEEHGNGYGYGHEHGHGHGHHPHYPVPEPALTGIIFLTLTATLVIWRRIAGHRARR